VTAMPDRPDDALFGARATQIFARGFAVLKFPFRIRKAA